MTATELRNVIADALVYASVPGFAGSRSESDFRGAIRDVHMAELQIDSLAGMELCIAIELNTGVSLAPTDIAAMPSLDALLRRLEAGQ